MKPIATAAVVLMTALTLTPTVASADSPEETKAPTSGFRAEFLMDMASLEKKVVGLADAVPADKYSWAPTPEVRDVAAVYIHLAQSNHQLLQTLGVEPPAGTADMETAITDKDGVIAALGASFAAVKHAVEGLSDDDLDTMVTLFGREWSKRQVLMLIAGHCHEHLGQSIAYARSVGVVPPWSRPRAD